MPEGWIKLHRQILSSQLWLEKPFAKGQAWVDLILLANHKQGGIWVRGIFIKLERGEVGWSQVKLSERWGWSRDKVARFLRSLKSRQQITQRTIQQNKYLTSIIIIINYSKYQLDDTAEPTAKPSADRQQTDSRQGSNKNEKNEKNEKKKTKEVFELPEWLPIRAWESYLEIRKKQKATDTAHALELIIKDLAKWREEGYGVEQILNNSIKASWKGVFKPKEQDGKDKQNDREGTGGVIPPKGKYKHLG